MFLTPIGADAFERCGKVVFSDMHVSSGSVSRPEIAFPGPGAGRGCATTDLTAQEKALAYMFFEIAACVPVVP